MPPEEHFLPDRAALALLGEVAAVVAHEVKNPLAGIAGAIEVIGCRFAPDAPETRVIRDVLRRVQSLDHMVEDLLVFAPPGPVSLRVLDAAPIVRACAARLSGDARWRGVAIDVGEGPLDAAADAQLLDLALFEVLLNAAETAGTLSRVQIGLSQGEDHGLITVSRTGSDLEPFDVTAPRRGGLGLAVARRLIERCGGTLRVRAPLSDESAFVVCLKRTLETNAR